MTSLFSFHWVTTGKIVLCNMPSCTFTGKSNEEIEVKREKNGVCSRAQAHVLVWDGSSTKSAYKYLKFFLSWKELSLTFKNNNENCWDSLWIYWPSSLRMGRADIHFCHCQSTLFKIVTAVSSSRTFRVSWAKTSSKRHISGTPLQQNREGFRFHRFYHCLQPKSDPWPSWEFILAQ